MRDSKDIAEAVEQALRIIEPDVKLSGERSGRALYIIDFEVSGEKGSITIDIEDEDLLCDGCSGMFGGTENLVPVTDGETFGVACTHRVHELKHWRELTADEREEFDEGSKALVQALKDASRKGV